MLEPESVWEVLEHSQKEKKRKERGSRLHQSNLIFKEEVGSKIGENEAHRKI